MEHAIEADELRADFAQAMKEYIREGCKLAALLKENADSVDSERLSVICDQQSRVNRARERFEHARIRYVRRSLELLGV